VSSDEGTPERYRLGGRERRGLLAGWRGGQIASVATGLALSVAMLRMLSGGAGMGAAALFTLAGVAGACWPVRGRTIDEWGPALVRQLALTATGERRWRDQAPWSGKLADGQAAPRAARKGCFDGITVGGSPDGRCGVVFDGGARTCSAVIACTGSGFALLGWEERGDRVSAWSRLLASVARDGTGVHRLQWIERCAPDDGAGLREHFAALAADGTATPAGRSYGELLDVAGRAGVRHELHVVVTVREPRRAGRGAAVPRDVALERLARETASLERGLRQAGAVVLGVLSCDELRALIAAAFEETAGLPHDGPWPSAYDVEWDHLRADGLVHATYWVAEWPRSDVGNDFLVPFVTGGAVRRTIALTLAPVAPLQATRHAEQARTSGVADAELRRRHGFAVTARARQQHDDVLARESELAAGHASYRFSGYVTVSAPDMATLGRACEVMERLAAGSQLDLRRLYGTQDAAFLATLPLGRGLA
jgi:hypothetical protein